MSRSVLTSLMIITAIVTFAVGSSTLALFTDTETRASSQLSTGDVEITLAGTGASQAIAFGTVCNQAMAPGDACNDVLTLTNSTAANALSVTYTIEVWADADGTDDGTPGSGGDTLVTCVNVEFDATPDGTVADQSTTGAVTGTWTDDDFDPGETTNYTLEAGVDDVSSCQATTVTIMGIVIATQSASPHD